MNDRRDVPPELRDELESLIAAGLSRQITSPQARRLNDLLHDPATLDLYLELVHANATLLTWSGFQPPESDRSGSDEGLAVPFVLPSTEIPPAAAPPRKAPVLGFLGGVIDYASHSRMLMLWLIAGLLGLYFAFQLGSLLISRFWAQNAAQLAHNDGAGTEKHGPAGELLGGATGKVVAHLTDAVDCQWQAADASTPRQPSAHGLQPLPLGVEFHAGQKLALAAGLAELTFDSGAKVILHAPARFDVTDTMGGNLKVGKLSAKVPHAAAGFTIVTPGGKVVDLGTEFGVKVNDDGKMDVVVYVGDVKFEPGAGAADNGAADHSGDIHLSAGHAIQIGADKIARPIPTENERFVRDLSSLGEKTKAEAAYVEFMKTLKPVVWLRMEGKETDRVLHDETGGTDAKLSWDGPGNPFVKGQIGKGVWLRGVKLKDYAVVPDYPKAEHGKLTVCAWAYADSRPTFATVASNWGGVRGQFHFGLTQDGGDGQDISVSVLRFNAPLRICREGATQPFPLYEWQHVAFTIDGTTVRLFRQGREVATANFPGLPYPVASKALAIGASLDATDQQPAAQYPNFWDGKLDEIAVFNDALSAEAIRKLANFVLH